MSEIVQRNFEIVRQKLESLSSHSFEQDKQIVALREQVAILSSRLNSLEPTVMVLKAISTGTGSSVH